jgi:hypothetical protein
VDGIYKQVKAFIKQEEENDEEARSQQSSGWNSYVSEEVIARRREEEKVHKDLSGKERESVLAAISILKLVLDIVDDSELAMLASKALADASMIDSISAEVARTEVTEEDIQRVLTFVASSPATFKRNISSKTRMLAVINSGNTRNGEDEPNWSAIIDALTLPDVTANPPQGYPPQAYPQQAYPPQYAPQAYPPQYAPQAFAPPYGPPMTWYCTPQPSPGQMQMQPSPAMARGGKRAALRSKPNAKTYKEASRIQRKRTNRRTSRSFTLASLSPS